MEQDHTHPGHEYHDHGRARAHRSGSRGSGRRRYGDRQGTRRNRFDSMPDEWREHIERWFAETADHLRQHRSSDPGSSDR